MSLLVHVDLQRHEMVQLGGLLQQDAYCRLEDATTATTGTSLLVPELVDCCKHLQ